MPSFFDKLKFGSHKHHGESKPQEAPKQEEPTLSIQPHPATTNDPQDLHPREPGIVSGEQLAQGPGPVIPTEQMLDNIGEPKTREELNARSAQLNSQE